VVLAATQARVPACIVVTGHADPPGTIAVNQRISEARALRVSDALQKHGIPVALLRPVGAGVKPGVTPEHARTVSFRVNMDRACEEGS
jgi:outer membrane protein OmpA-like peptidoglycan-associated protein